MGSDRMKSVYKDQCEHKAISLRVVSFGVQVQNVFLEISEYLKKSRPVLSLCKAIESKQSVKHILKH